MPDKDIVAADGGHDLFERDSRRPGNLVGQIDVIVDGGDAGWEHGSDQVSRQDGNRPEAKPLPRPALAVQNRTGRFGRRLRKQLTATRGIAESGGVLPARQAGPIAGTEGWGWELGAGGWLGTGGWGLGNRDWGLGTGDSGLEGMAREPPAPSP